MEDLKDFIWPIQRFLAINASSLDYFTEDKEWTLDIISLALGTSLIM